MTASREENFPVSALSYQNTRAVNVSPLFDQSILTLRYKESVGLQGVQNQNIMSFKAQTTNLELYSTCIS